MNERRNGSCRCGERAQYAHYAPYGPRTMPHSHSHKDACTAAEKKSYTHYSHAEKVEQARSCGCEKRLTMYTPAAVPRRSNAQALAAALKRSSGKAPAAAKRKLNMYPPAAARKKQSAKVLPSPL